ncbi:acetylglutamate kinase [Ulvibacterium marinum]|uniref:acetylglutamate kinase n=1 Tax=Ulvibacterium marinum TaxID=2419782 RepID=UPI0024943154|nr:acetylglutamate kinase [Ulvibacterium marinum]
MKSKLAVVKIGGNVIENKAELLAFLNLFAKMEGPKILVHGGGKKATQILKKLGMTPKMAGGRRITDAESLEVVTMVYGGLTNKTIVAQLQALACNAIGLSGADADAIRAHKRPVKEIDYGFAGDVDIVNVNSISNLLNSGFVPVFCALTHNGEGQLLNTNADTIASEIAIGMSHSFETTLYYCFEKKGVLLDMADDNSVIKTIDSKTYMEIREKDIISEGMLPKLENCFHALQKNVREVCIGDISMIDSESKLFTTLTL